MKGILRDPSKSVAILLPVLLIAAAPSIRHRIHSEKAAVTQSAPDDIEARNHNAFAVILGEIGATAADLMFIKTEDYIHGGVRYRPHINYDRMATTGEITATGRPHAHSQEKQPTHSGENHLHGPHDEGSAEEHDNHPDHEHGVCPGGVPTLIRSAADDFRGFIGDLERETKPYRDPKLPHPRSGSSQELLPWYRLMTLSDPHNLRGYMIGTMLLMFANKPHEALSFIQEGIEKNRDNPQGFRLYASLTQVHWKCRRLDEALAAARTGYQMGKGIRPEGGLPQPLRRLAPPRRGESRSRVQWTEDLENDFMFLARFFPLLLEKKGRLQEALRVAEEVASLVPDDAATKQMVDRLRKELAEQRPTEG